MFENVLGQERAKQLLSGAMIQERVGHAYLFSGPKGMGKHTLAMAFAKALRCEASMEARPCGFCESCRKISEGVAPDLIIVEAEPDETSLKIGRIRELIAQIGRKSWAGNLRIMLIVGADRMTIEAQNALLKSLEEPSPGNVFLLLADNQEKILPTIRSRCQVIALSPVSDAVLREILAAHDMRLSHDEFCHIAREAKGNPGVAFSLLENDGEEKLKKDAFLLICDIIEGKLAGIFAFSDQMGKLKEESKRLVDDLIILFEGAYRVALGADACGLADDRMRVLAQKCSAKKLEKALGVWFAFSEKLQYNVNLRLQWEAVWIEIDEIFGVDR